MINVLIVLCGSELPLPLPAFLLAWNSDHDQLALKKTTFFPNIQLHGGCLLDVSKEGPK